MKIRWKIILLLAVIAGLGTWLSLDHRSRGRAEDLWRQISTSVAHADESSSAKAWTPKSRFQATLGSHD